MCRETPWPPPRGNRVNLFQRVSKFQKACSILRMGCALSKWPNFLRAYLVTICKGKYTAVSADSKGKGKAVWFALCKHQIRYITFLWVEINCFKCPVTTSFNFNLHWLLKISYYLWGDQNLSKWLKLGEKARLPIKWIILILNIQVLGKEILFFTLKKT